ncbi:hypothetical protein IFM89_037213 [Coptis chinensis]|uniref:Glycosyltransferase family 92 protein n=1 Tax=Coptis chinensis TaxID=261450 RepID=A0A835I733_9MAGN|nr:hypothetical protein IFM89_037213 [Coptis chinensis]
MRRKTRTTFLSLVTTIFLFASFSLFFSSNQEKQETITQTNIHSHVHNLIIQEEKEEYHPHVTTSPDSILFPDWEVVVVFSPEYEDADDTFTCVFQNNDTSPAISSGILPFNKRATFKCILPNRVRRYRPFYQPIFTTASHPISFPTKSEMPELFRWNFLAYETLSTENDVILFVKGVNKHQGMNHVPENLHCVFSNGDKTPVISSVQEVFRCHHPSYRKNIEEDEKYIKVSLEISENNNRLVVPSVAYYAPPAQRRTVEKKEKSLICACTMVYNVAKFLKEWVVYHSNIGVEKFFLYDNGSDDELEKVVNEVLERGYRVETILWPWTKTQEAGFSHCATYANDTCTWMMYIDVDEFIFSPKWLSAPHPSSHMLTSFLPKKRPNAHVSILPQIGQVMIMCYEFGPSNQRVHPVKGVMQGYTCRTRIEQRHKSIVLLDAIDVSLLNVIHHFELENGYRVKKLSSEEGVVNHYKYQAWSEFKTKFRRRVSAYVVDWKQEVNPKSKDRTPGLGFEPVEPKGWINKFCDVQDYRLKNVTQRWFGLGSSSGYKMAWQDV